MGDPSGIGPEIIIKALDYFNSNERKQFILIGNSFVFNKFKGFKKITDCLEFIDINNVSRNKFNFGEISASNGQASLDYLNKALDLVKTKQISGIVTCPVCKISIDRVANGFRGQTEYLARQINVKLVRMMLLSGRLRFVLVTTHLALAQVHKRLNIPDLVSTIVLTDLELNRLFNIKIRLIGVCGLNPHLGESGLLGQEEIKLITPAIKLAQDKITGSKILGPLSLERIVFSLFNRKLSAGICMYHDQAMMPLKLICPARGVNLTLGLPFVRTSPLHGTAFDIAGKNKASPRSLIEAIKLTLKLSKRC